MNAADLGVEGLYLGRGDLVLAEADDLRLGFQKPFGEAPQFHDACIERDRDPRFQRLARAFGIAIEPELLQPVLEQVGEVEIGIGSEQLSQRGPPRFSGFRKRLKRWPLMKVRSSPLASRYERRRMRSIT